MRPGRKPRGGAGGAQPHDGPYSRPESGPEARPRDEGLLDAAGLRRAIAEAERRAALIGSEEPPSGRAGGYEAEPRARRAAPPLGRDRDRAPERPDGNLLVPVLGAVAAILALAILGGTIYAFARGLPERARLRDAERLRLEAGERASETRGYAVYEGVGRIRASTADGKPAIVVATLSFPYPAADRAFAEELSRKRPALKAAARDFLASKKAEELHPSLEGGIKAGLRDALNAVLSLGKVEELWLSDFAVLE